MVAPPQSISNGSRFYRPLQFAIPRGVIPPTHVPHTPYNPARQVAHAHRLGYVVHSNASVHRGIESARTAASIRSSSTLTTASAHKVSARAGRLDYELVASGKRGTKCTAILSRVGVVIATPPYVLACRDGCQLRPLLHNWHRYARGCIVYHCA